MPKASGIISNVVFFGPATGFLTGGIEEVFGFSTLGALQNLLFDAPGEDESFISQSSKRTQLVRTPITYRKYPFGDLILGGTLTFYESTRNNSRHHLVMTVGEAPVEEWEGWEVIWIDDTPVFYSDVDPNTGVVNAGKMQGKIRLKVHLGGPDQLADEDLIEDIDRLDENFRGRGVAYVYVRINNFDREIFPNGLPSIKGFFRTNKVYDPRDATRKYLPNGPLVLREYLTNSEAGLGYSAETLSTPALTAPQIAAISARELSLRWLVQMEFDSGTSRFWSGFGDLTALGETWVGTGRLGTIGNITDGQETVANGLNLGITIQPTADIPDAPDAFLNIALGEEFQNRPITIYLALLDPASDTPSLIGDPIIRFFGKMDVMEDTELPGAVTLRIAAENELISLERPRNKTYTPEDQKSVYPDDTFFDEVAQLQQRKIVLKSNTG